MKKGRIASVVLMLIIIVYLLIPLAATAIYSLFANWTHLVPQGFTLQNYITLFQNADFVQSLENSLLICIVPILITVLVVLLTLFVVTVYFPKLEKYVQLLCMIPYTIQGVILSISIISLYSASDSFLGIRLVMLVGAYCIIILPYIYNGIRNSMHAVNMPMLLDAAEMLGDSKIAAFFKVIVPNIVSGITVSSLLAVGIIFGDYVLIRNIAGSTFENMQVYLYLAMKRSSTESAAVFVIIMLITFVIAAVVLFLQSRSRLSRIESKEKD